MLNPIASIFIAVLATAAVLLIGAALGVVPSWQETLVVSIAFGVYNLVREWL